jgi:hypothetical protein
MTARSNDRRAAAASPARNAANPFLISGELTTG